MIALAHGTHYAGCTSCGNAESHTALLYVRAADVELDGRNIVESVDAGGTFCIVVGRRTAYIDNHVGVDVLYLRIDVLAEVVDTLVLQTDAVEHTLCCLSHTRIVVALARIERSALNDDATYAVERYEVGEFEAVAECSRCGHNGILEFQTAYFYT